MSLNTLPPAQALGNFTNLRQLLKEMQGLNVTVVDGAAAGTAMNIAAIRTEDTILSAIKLADVWAAPVDDAANITIQGTKATGTLTISGNPVDGETFIVAGTTYTFKTAPTAGSHVKITAGDNNAMAASVVKVVNAYEGRYQAQLNGDQQRVARIKATALNNVVTFTSKEDGAGNGPIVSRVGAPITLSATDPGAITATLVSVVADNTITVNGITFTAKAAPTTDAQFTVKGTDALQGPELARAINAYQTKYGTLDVVATAVLGVVTIKSNKPRTGNSITLTEAATNVAVSGAGYLAGGTNTGSIKSTTDLSTATLIVVWVNKQ